ncbi:MAG: UvrD-helicase domain-containing protein [Alphaproteobacteria bacterium]|nr:UvrD-helicase domain-containing protein [Alphaproteobacteria bacterium]
MSDLLKSLNAAQAHAVQQTEGPVLALAGAGTGKTHVLITRIAYIVEQNLAEPHEILAVTFTNKAAAEMQERLSQKAGNVRFQWCGTFHSIAVRILRSHIDMIGFERSFTILDVDDQIRVLEEIIDEHIPAHNQAMKKRELARKISDCIQRWKDKGLWSHQVSIETLSDGGVKVLSQIEKLAAKVYPLYQGRLAQIRCLDYGDIILFCVRLFQESPDILMFYQDLFKYICVDEFQDTSALQDLWVKLLSEKRKNICCVGDDDQSIYKWRGAEVGNILSFGDRYPGATIVRLEQNYRSTGNILAVASGLIARNQHRLGKTLWTESLSGDAVRVRGFWSPKQEGSWIAMRILNAVKNGTPLQKIAILVRSNYLTRNYEDALTHVQIPYRVVGGMRFYDRMEVKDILAYLRLVVHDHDDVAFQRCCNTPKRGVGEAKMSRIRAFARENNLSYIKAMQALAEDGVFKGESARGVGVFLESVAHWRAMLSTHTLGQVIQDIIERSGYEAMLKQEQSVMARARMDNLKELCVAVEDFPRLEDFLAHISLMTSADSATSLDGVMNIMTIHAAKGLEFDDCFLVAWERDVFPTRRALDSHDVQNVEEERRLGYVALTRARYRVYITFTQGGTNAFNRGRGPSIFLKELPRDCIDISDVSDGYGVY